MPDKGHSNGSKFCDQEKVVQTYSFQKQAFEQENWRIRFMTVLVYKVFNDLGKGILKNAWEG